MIAYGFVSLEDLFDQRVSQVGVRRVYSAIDESAAEHNRVLSELMGAFVRPTTDVQIQFELPGGGSLQPIGPDGNPIPVKPSGNYQVAFPIAGGATAWGDNRITRPLLTVDEANRRTVDAQQKDVNWLRMGILSAILTNTTYQYDDKIGPNGGKGQGPITIYPLANGDTVEYVLTGGDTDTAHDHYDSQDVAIDASNNPLPDIMKHLTHHPSNSGPYVLYVASNLTESIRGLADFVKVQDPDIQPGSGTDTIRGSISRGFGDEVIGKAHKFWIVEWSALPDGYMIAHARGAGPVLGMRQWPTEELQGFFREEFDADGNHKGVRMFRFAGFGAENRVAAFVYQVGAAVAGTYEIPTGYEAPLPGRG